MKIETCDCGLTLILRPVPGAKYFPRRLECPEHGYPQERKSSLFMKNLPSDWCNYQNPGTINFKT